MLEGVELLGTEDGDALLGLDVGAKLVGELDEGFKEDGAELEGLELEGFALLGMLDDGRDVGKELEGAILEGLVLG
jgi:hypothetical protein